MFPFEFSLSSSTAFCCCRLLKLSLNLIAMKLLCVESSKFSILLANFIRVVGVDWCGRQDGSFRFGKKKKSQKKFSAKKKFLFQNKNSQIALIYS